MSVTLPDQRSGTFEVAIVSLPDRRHGTRTREAVEWFFQGHLNTLLFHRLEGGSAGAMRKMIKRAGLKQTTFHVTKQAIDDKLVEKTEFDELLSLFVKYRAKLIQEPANGSARHFTLVPLRTVAAMARAYDEDSEHGTILRALLK